MEVMPHAEGRLIEDVKRDIRAAGTAKRDRAADIGIRVHASTAAGLAPDMAPDDERPLIYQYQHWLATSGFHIHHSERQVFNLRLGYGGSFDLLGDDKDSRVGLLDIKTGSGLYLDHVLQLLGYTFAEFIGEDDVIDRDATAMLEHVSFIGLVHLQPEGWEYIELAVDDTARRAFTAMCRLAHFLDDKSVADYTIRNLTGAASVPPRKEIVDAGEPTDPR